MGNAAVKPGKKVPEIHTRDFIKQQDDIVFPNPPANNFLNSYNAPSAALFREKQDRMSNYGGSIVTNYPPPPPTRIPESNALDFPDNNMIQSSNMNFAQNC